MLRAEEADLHGQRLRKLGTLQAALATLQAMTAAAVRPNTVLGHRRHVSVLGIKDFGLAKALGQGLQLRDYMAHFEVYRDP